MSENLYRAIEACDIKLIKKELLKGCNLAEKNKNGENPIDFAISVKASSEVLELLQLASKANMQYQDECKIEQDTMGTMLVEKNKYYGAQTQRSLMNFKIGQDLMPKEMILAIVQIKKAAARTNTKLNLLSEHLADEIIITCNEIVQNINDLHPQQFPLSLWQTGSGTQTNMNVNEVVAGITNARLIGIMGGKIPVHPNDHVNCSQSSNDTFPTAMNIAGYLAVTLKLLPSAIKMLKILNQKAIDFAEIIKIGRTHLQDATPITLGQEFSGYQAQIKLGIERIIKSSEGLLALAQGGTAVGTGLNSHPDFSMEFANQINDCLDMEKIDLQSKKRLQEAGFCTSDFKQHRFKTADNKFEALAANDAIVEISGSINTLAVSLFKIANDIRLMSSGPRSGIGEISLPENEPGSSIMPGKVNPTQCEAMTMVCVKVMGNHSTITFAGSQGHFELNVFKPVMIGSLLHSIAILADAMESFCDNCLVGIEPNLSRISDLMSQSLMLVTALNTHIGYDNAAKIAKKAHKDGTTLLKAAMELELLTEEQFELWINPSAMTKPSSELK